MVRPKCVFPCTTGSLTRKSDKKLLLLENIDRSITSLGDIANLLARLRELVD